MVKVNACKSPMFLFEIDWDQHFRAYKDIDVSGFISSLYLSVFYAVPKERGSEEGFPLTVNSGLFPVGLSCDGVI
jgi:hypothetical protein